MDVSHFTFFCYFLSIFLKISKIFAIKSFFIQRLIFLWGVILGTLSYTFH